MQPRCAMRFEIASDAKKFFASDAKTHSFDLEKDACENPAMLACDAKNRDVFQDRAMQNAFDSDSRCVLACDVSAGDAKSLAMWVGQRKTKGGGKLRAGENIP